MATQAGRSRTTMLRRAALGAVAALALLGAGCSSSDEAATSGTTAGTAGSTGTSAQPPHDDGHRQDATVTPNPYYVAAKALSATQVQAGATVGGCVIVAYTKCPGATSPDEYLQGGFLAYADPAGADLAGANLLQASVAYRRRCAGANLQGTKLSATATTEASFADANLTDVERAVRQLQHRLQRCEPAAAPDFTSAGRPSSFAKANLHDGQLHAGRPTGADLTDATLDGAVFCQTVMPDGTIRNPQPSAETAVETCGAAVAAGDEPLTINDENPYYPLVVAYSTPYVETGSVVAGCTVVARTECAGSDFAGQSLFGVIMPYANLENADFAGGNLDQITLDLAMARGANLSGVTLNGASLSGTDLTGANLTKAVMQFGSLNGATFAGADLAGANFDFSSTIGTDFSGANLQGASFADGDNSGANLTDADLSGTNLTNADFTGATLTGANLEGAIFCNTLMPDASVKNPVNGPCPGQ
ncbi:MAG: pentapeptide repeat-containing protein [Acidimicrobiales bacterium]